MAADQRAIVLLSGGLDSATALAVAKNDGYEIYAMSFDYGQRHRIELDSARRVARSLAVKDHRIIKLDPSVMSGSALTGKVDVPKSRSEGEMGAGIPVTYVPARNTLFLAHSVAWAEVIGANHIFIGVNAIDYSGYPDCRPEYISAFEKMANLGTKTGVSGAKLEIHTPLINLTKGQIIRQANSLGVDLSLTHSCYDPLPDGRACGQCDSCQLRLKGFRDAGLTDPVKYAK